MSRTTQSTGYALLIGVDDYSAYDASVKAAPGDTNDLRGSVNDVRAWYKLCRELGYPAENIRVLTSPEIARPELEGATVGPATDGAIHEGVAWLADKLGAPDRPAGVLTFSGHGSMSPKGLLLCPTNVKADGDDLTNTVNLLEIQAAIASRNAGRNLTVVLDCCHVGGGAGDGSRKATALRGRAQAAGQSIVAPMIGDTMFFASELGSAAYQAELGGRWHGAFTWAFMTVKEQWTVIESPSGNKELSISNANMRSRTEALLAALSFEQRPALRSTPNAAALPVFHRGPVAAPDATSSAPDAERTQVQLDGGQKGYRLYWFYYIYNSGYNYMGQVLVPNTAKTYGTTTYSPTTEYWYLLGVNVPTGASQLYISWQDYDWGTAAPSTGTLSFTMKQDAAWISTTAPGSSAMLFVLNGQSAVSLSWGLTYSSGRWSGSLTWYNNTGDNTVFGGTGQSVYYLSSNMTPTASWFQATVAPQ